MLNITSEQRALVAQFQQHADPAYREGNLRVVRTGLVMVGVRTPDLQAIARAWQQAHPQVRPDELLALVEALWRGPSQEERVCAMLLLLRFPRLARTLHWEHFDRWRRLIDNWGLDDLLATKVFGPWVLAEPTRRLAHLDTLIADPDVWSRRLALVATVPLNRSRAGPATPELTFGLIDQVKCERDPMITKAVSWALRELAKGQPERVAAYLDANRGILAALAVREVQNKLRTGLKSGKERHGAHS
jgi:3-methyladenine DNA glycosylase AlkD